MIIPKVIRAYLCFQRLLKIVQEARALGWTHDTFPGKCVIWMLYCEFKQ